MDGSGGGASQEAKRERKKGLTGEVGRRGDLRSKKAQR
jgi:hypothetical protein